MDHATDKSVLGDFNDASFTYYGRRSRFFRQEGKFLVETDGPDGKLATFEIKYTFGVDPLQQYLVEFPDGRLQALPLAWDSRPNNNGGQRWFHIYPNEEIRHDDYLHWTKLNQNWNYMCAECHSTGVRKNYDASNDRYVIGRFEPKNPSISGLFIASRLAYGPSGQPGDNIPRRPTRRRPPRAGIEASSTPMDQPLANSVAPDVAQSRTAKLKRGPVRPGQRSPAERARREEAERLVEVAALVRDLGREPTAVERLLIDELAALAVRSRKLRRQGKATDDVARLMARIAGRLGMKMGATSRRSVIGDASSGSPPS